LNPGAPAVKQLIIVVDKAKRHQILIAHQDLVFYVLVIKNMSLPLFNPAKVLFCNVSSFHIGFFG
jgi:hypothetical protein